MTQKLMMLELFRKHNNVLTLGQILQTTLAAEYRARMTEMRHDGFVINFQRGKRPSENKYTLAPLIGGRI